MHRTPSGIRIGSSFFRGNFSHRDWEDYTKMLVSFENVDPDGFLHTVWAKKVTPFWYLSFLSR